MTKSMRQRNREYWNAQARGDAMWHISHSNTEEHFRASGARDARKLFGEGLDAIPLQGRVLEIGCGLGRVMEHLSEAHPEAYFFGVDVSTEMVSEANRRLRQRRNTFVLRTLGDSLGAFDDDYFDVVYSLMVFQHLPQQVFAAYANEVRRVLIPGGMFRFQVQYDRSSNGVDELPADNFRDIRYYDAESLRRIFPNSLMIVEHPTDPTAARIHDYYVTARKQ